METFKLNGKDFIQLCDLLKMTGLCATGGQAKNCISDGEVLVDGETELRKRCKIKDGQIIQFQDKSIKVIL